MPKLPLSLHDDVERLLVRRNAHAVRFAGIGDDAMHLAVGVDAIDRLHRLLDRLMADIARIAEIDSALLVDGRGRWAN